MVHVLDCRLDWWQLGRNWGSVGWLKESWAEIVLCEWETSLKEERNEVTTAATVAVVIVVARLAIALIVESVHVAAALTFIQRDVIRIMRFIETNFLKRVLVLTEINSMLFIQSIIDFRGKSSWAETTLNHSMACRSSVSHGC